MTSPAQTFWYLSVAEAVCCRSSSSFVCGKFYLYVRRTSLVAPKTVVWVVRGVKVDNHVTKVMVVKSVTGHFHSRCDVPCRPSR